MTVDRRIQLRGRVIPTLAGVVLLAFVVTAAIAPNISGSAPAQTGCAYNACPPVSPSSGISALEIGGIIGLLLLIALIAALVLLRSRRQSGGGAAVDDAAAGGAAGGPPGEGPVPEWNGPDTGTMPSVKSEDGWQIGKDAAASKGGAGAAAKPAAAAAPTPAPAAVSPAPSSPAPVSSVKSPAAASSSPSASSGSETEAEYLATAGASAVGGAAIGAAVASDRRKKGTSGPSGAGGAPAAAGAAAAAGATGAEPNIDSLMEELDRIGREILKKDREKPKPADGSADAASGGDETAS